MVALVKQWLASAFPHCLLLVAPVERGGGERIPYGGVAVIVRNRSGTTWSVVQDYVIAEGAALRVTLKNNHDQIFHVISVYAPSGSGVGVEAARAHLFDLIMADLLRVLEEHDGEVVVGGDYNCVLQPSDSVPPAPVRRSADVIACRRLLEGIALRDPWVELAPDAAPLEGVTRRAFGDRQSSRRLDRFYVSAPLLWEGPSVEVVRGSPSDHAAILFSGSLPSLEAVGPGLWRMPTFLPALPEYRAFMKPYIDSFVASFMAESLDPQAWDGFKEHVCLLSSSFVKIWRARQSARRRDLMHIINAASTDQHSYSGYTWAVRAEAERLLAALDAEEVRAEARRFDVDVRELDERPCY